MNPESSLKLQTLEKFPVLMTKEKVAEALGVATHTIPPLVRAGLLKPLGHPGRYCVKHFSRDALAEKFASPEWLDKVAAAIHRHWRNKMHGNGQSRPGIHQPREYKPASPLRGGDHQLGRDVHKKERFNPRPARASGATIRRASCSRAKAKKREVPLIFCGFSQTPEISTALAVLGRQTAETVPILQPSLTPR
jgi:hypothetical protein